MVEIAHRSIDDRALDGVSSLRFSTVIAWPAMRASGSVGRSTEPGPVPVMAHWSSASEVVPVRSSSAK